MKIKYEIDELLDDDVIVIRVNKLTQELIDLQNAFEMKQVDSLFGMKDGKTFPIKPTSIERIYSNNRKTILYSNGAEYETRKTLNEFEHSLGEKFVRISKGVIANTKLVKSIETEFSGNFTLFFLSGNKEILSRKYVKNFKKAIGLEG